MLLETALVLALGQHLRGSHPTDQDLTGLRDPGGPGVEILVGGRLWVQRLLLDLPAGVEVGLQGLVETVANALEFDLDDWLPRAIVRRLPRSPGRPGRRRHPPPHPGASLRLGPRASTVIGSALAAAGEEVSPDHHPGQLTLSSGGWPL
jgi:hypothetical protein